MSKLSLTVFLCTGKDCARAWRRVCDGSPGKWLRRRVEAAGLPFKLRVVKTECLDRCERAACLCCVAGRHAGFATDVRSPHDADRLLATLRSTVESRDLTPPGSGASAAAPAGT
jgi:hypothetical protein